MIKEYTKKSDGKKYYMVKVYLGKDEISKKDRYTTRRGFKTKKEALLCEAKLKTDVANNGLLNNEITTFQELYNLWFEGYKHTVKENSLIVSEHVFKVILSEFGSLQLKKITIPYCQKVLNKWFKEYKTYKKLKSYVVNMLNFAIELRIITTNPMAVTKTPKQIQEIKDNKEVYYTKDELKKFFELIQETEEFYTVVMFRLLAFTGLRKCEVLALLWSDIDLTNGTINVNKTLAYNKNYELVSQTPKSKASIRKISIDNKTSLMLRKWKLEQKQLLLKLGFNTNKKDQACFTNLATNEYFRKNYLNYRLDAICKQHNLKRIKIHGFRHTHCSLLFESGVTIQEVQERLGHSDIKVTMNIYAHVTEKQKEEVGKKFAKYVNF